MVTVMSRNNAIEYCNNRHDNKVVIISISTPRRKYSNRPFKSDVNGVIDILRLRFFDADKPMKMLGYGDVSWNELITEKDALKISEFVKKYSGYDIIVHCDAGVSRSAGVAAAILKYLYNDDTEIFGRLYYHPNMLCYRRTLEALYN